MNRKLGIVITDGVGFRNFVLSDFLNQAAKGFSEVYIYSGLPVQHFNLEFQKNVFVRELSVYRESRTTWFFRRLKEIAHLFKHQEGNYGIQDTLRANKPKGLTPRSYLNRIIFLIARFLHSEYWILHFERLQFASFSNSSIFREYKYVLKNDLPDILLFTHQRPPYLAPFLKAGQQLNIKNSTFIFSWDNLASKGRMLGDFNSFLVWSELMKSELQEFYPNSINKIIAVVGTPQFEPYVMDKYKVDKDFFIKRFDLDYNAKIICYSCADSAIGGNDEIHIRSIWNFIKNNNKYQLLVRTSPAEDGSRFNKLRQEIPEIKWNIPKWIQSRTEHDEAWSQRIPTEEDVIDIKSLLTFSDVNVNMLSTMSLDFMLFDKPVVNTVFGNEENGLYNDQRFLNYRHYKYVIESNAVSIAKNEEELHEQLIEAIETPNKREIYRRNILELEIGGSLEGTSKRIEEALLKI